MVQGKNIKKIIPERWLYWTYLHPEFLKTPLSVASGESLRIIHPGERNFDNGPDFQGAVLEINGIRIMGDVEFHVYPQEWFHHGHQDDLRYRNVILHGVLEIPEPLSPSLEKRFPHWEIGRFLKIPYSLWLKKMQSLEQFQFQALPGYGRELQKLNELSLEELALRRFLRKTERLRTWAGRFTLNDILFIALGEALGYVQNKHAFRQLLTEYPPLRLNALLGVPHRSTLNYWLLLGILSGMITSRHQQLMTGPEQSVISGLFREICPVLNITDWHFSRMRPANNPQVRLAALAHWMFVYQNPALFERLLSVAVCRYPTAVFIQEVMKVLQLSLPPSFLGYLKQQLRFKNLPRKTIGNTRVLQFIINGLLPLLYWWAQRKNNFGFAEYLLGVYFEIPAVESSSKFTTLCHQLSSPHLQTRVLQYAYLQQGLLEFYDHQVGDLVIG